MGITKNVGLISLLGAWQFICFAYKLNGWRERESRESSRVEILTIIMLAPTGWIGLGYGFGVEHFRILLK